MRVVQAWLKQCDVYDFGGFEGVLATGGKSHDLADSGGFKRARDLTEPGALFSLSHKSSGCVMGGLRRAHSLMGGTGRERLKSDAALDSGHYGMRARGRGRVV